MRLADLAHPSFRLVVGGDEHDVDDLERRAADLARDLPAGRVVELPAGDARLALIALAAAWQAGAVPLPGSAARAPTALDLDPPPDAALVLRTSGSTGAPRLPVFRAAAIVAAAARIAGYLELTPDDTVALLQPCDHGFGLVGQLLAAAAAGARAVWCGRPFPAERAAAVAAARATVVAAVPYGLAQLADHLDDREAAARVRQVGSAGGPLSPDLARGLVAAFPNAVVWNQYGCTEAGPRLTAVPSTHPAFFTGTVGRPIAGVRLWIEPPRGGALPAPAGALGEICFATDTAMVGYLGGAGATHGVVRRDGFATGDLGILDEAGRLHVVGRADDLVKIRGERVSLERVARGAEAAGADAALAVVVEPRRDEADPQLVVVYEGPREVRPAALLGSLPAGVAPRRMLWVPSLPRLASGKLDRTTIEAIVRGDAP